MAKISLEISGNGFEALKELAQIFPTLNASLLGYVGHESKLLLKKNLLSGQELNLKGSDTDPRDRSGKRTINYVIAKNKQYASIKSYPVNLYEFGRTLRSGRKETGKRILSSKLKQLVSSNLTTFSSEFDTKILQKELDKYK